MLPLSEHAGARSAQAIANKCRAFVRKTREGDFSLASQDACALSQASGVKNLASARFFTLQLGVTGGFDRPVFAVLSQPGYMRCDTLNTIRGYHISRHSLCCLCRNICAETPGIQCAGITSAGRNILSFLADRGNHARMYHRRRTDPGGFPQAEAIRAWWPYLSLLEFPTFVENAENYRLFL